MPCDCSHLFRRELPHAWRKDEADRVGPKLHRHLRVIKVRIAADLHMHAVTSHRRALDSQAAPLTHCRTNSLPH
jgi:hypothetical protein